MISGTTSCHLPRARQHDAATPLGDDDGATGLRLQKSYQSPVDNHLEPHLQATIESASCERWPLGLLCPSVQLSLTRLGVRETRKKHHMRPLSLGRQTNRMSRARIPFRWHHARGPEYRLLSSHPGAPLHSKMCRLSSSQLCFSDMRSDFVAGLASQTRLRLRLRLRRATVPVSQLPRNRLVMRAGKRWEFNFRSTFQVVGVQAP
jgi:hypothetical protein